MGYRHIDCAYGYGNESEVGKALEYGLKELKIPRKVPNYRYLNKGRSSRDQWEQMYKRGAFLFVSEV